MPSVNRLAKFFILFGYLLVQLVEFYPNLSIQYINVEFFTRTLVISLRFSYIFLIQFARNIIFLHKISDNSLALFLPSILKRIHSYSISIKYGNVILSNFTHCVSNNFHCAFTLHNTTSGTDSGATCKASQ